MQRARQCEAACETARETARDSARQRDTARDSARERAWARVGERTHLEVRFERRGGERVRVPLPLADGGEVDEDVLAELRPRPPRLGDGDSQDIGAWEQLHVVHAASGGQAAQHAEELVGRVQPDGPSAQREIEHPAASDRNALSLCVAWSWRRLVEGVLIGCLTSRRRRTWACAARRRCRRAGRRSGGCRRHYTSCGAATRSR